MVEQLPNGYEQMLGKRFTGGVDLSGGQWQKVALARAYMRESQLIILDEPTAALDARAEHEVFIRFAELMKGKAAVLISTVSAPCVWPTGFYSSNMASCSNWAVTRELVAQGGKYAELFRLQAKGYV